MAKDFLVLVMERKLELKLILEQNSAKQLDEGRTKRREERKKN